MPPATLHSIYRGIVQSHFDYCNAVWDSCSKTLSDKLQRPQSRAARGLTFFNYDADANELMKILGWKNLETQRQIHKARLVYKSLNGLHPITCPQNLYNAAILLRLIIFVIPRISLLFPYHAPITINIVSAIAVLFSGTVCPLLLGKQNLWLSFERC